MSNYFPRSGDLIQYKIETVELGDLRVINEIQLILVIDASENSNRARNIRQRHDLYDYKEYHVHSNSWNYISKNTTLIQRLE